MVRPTDKYEQPGNYLGDDIALGLGPGGNNDFHYINVDSSGNLKTVNIDSTARNSLNTVFGEKIVGIRQADIAAQFHYGIPAGSATSTTANGGTVSFSESMLVLSTGTNTVGSASIANRKALRYIPGYEAYMVFTAVFTQGADNSYQRAGLFDDNNGFFIGYENETFYATRRRDGVDFNYSITLGDVFNEGEGTFDPTKGNIYRISFGYLGFATINFEVLSPGGSWRKLYKIEYPNTAIITHITNTNLQPKGEVANDGNNTNIVLKSGSFAAGVVDGGGKDPSARKFTFNTVANTITAGTYHYITFRVKNTFNSLTNYIQSILTLLPIATDLSKNSVWEIRKNMTITNSPTWTDVNTNDSTVEYSTDATFTAGTGTVEMAWSMGKADRIFEDIEKQQVEMFPGDYLTFVIVTPVGTSGTFDFVIRWSELF